MCDLCHGSYSAGCPICGNAQKEFGDEKCSECREWFKEDEVTEYDGRMLCHECLAYEKNKSLDLILSMIDSQRVEEQLKLATA